MKITAWSCTLVVSLTLLQGCAADEPGSARAGAVPPGASSIHEQPQSGSHAKGAIDVTGVWRGASSAECATLIPDPSRCGAVNDVTFTLLQDGAKVGGLYKCTYGNMDCRDGDDTGKVARGSMGTSLLQMRVMMPDGSDCIFNGRPRGDAINGGYMCLQGGGIVERGIWRARRSY